MAIGTVIEDGIEIKVYDERGPKIASLLAHDGLTGYTSSTVSVRQGILFWFGGNVLFGLES
jgi:hypothetical protein